MNNKDLNVLSLFSGCGGMDLGFEGEFEVMRGSINEKMCPDWIDSIYENKIKLNSTRFSTIFANDILETAQKAWVRYFNKRGKDESIYNSKSIVDLVKATRNGDFQFPSRVDIVTGGFPCQDFSVAGLRNGFKSHKSHLNEYVESSSPTLESRGQLYMWMREVISLVLPKVFIAENVKGLISLGNVREIIENDFRTIDKNGFIVLSKLLNTADFGVPQARQRIIFIGLNKRYLKNEALINLQSKSLKDEYSPFPSPTHIKRNGFNNYELDLENKFKPYMTVCEALNGLKEPEECDNDLSQQNYSKARYYPRLQGNTEVNYNSLGPTIRAEHHGNIEFRRLSLEHNGKNIEELKNGWKERRLTVRECARLQTFPDDYEFVFSDNTKGNSLSASSSYKLIGNAVPPIMAYNIAKKLEKIWTNLFD